MYGASPTGKFLNSSWNTYQNTKMVTKGIANAHTIPNNELEYFDLMSLRDS